MRDIGTLIWVVVVILGIISSMRSSMRRQRQASQQSQAPPAQPNAPAPAQPTVQRVVLTNADARQRLLEILQQEALASGRQPPPAVVRALNASQPGPPPAQPPPPQPVQAVPPPVRAQPSPMPAQPQPRPSEPRPHEEPRRSRDLPLFRGQAAVRAIIAAEVLGKPRGLSDEYHF
jgi:hypothetical protein